MSFRWLFAASVLFGACTTGPHMLPTEETTPTDGVQVFSVGGELVIIPEGEDPLETTTTTIVLNTEPVLGTAYGRVVDRDGDGLAGATVTIGEQRAMTDVNGWFVVERALRGPMTISRPTWTTLETEWDGIAATIEMEPFVVRGIRAGRVVLNEDRFDQILDLAEQSAVNTIVFDTKDESGQVLYDSQVPLASEIGAINVLYDPEELIAQAHARGLYAITRIVTFEDNVWADSGDAQIIGAWVDARNEANWQYPIALGVEACEMGFDEIQFDYVRFPAGKTGGELNRRENLTQEIRVGAIESFLESAREQISPLGCGVSAAVFAITMSALDDQGIGQKPEELSIHLDAISPMIYPSHYGAGWLGLDNPNEHNATVTADALDDGSPRLAATTLMRPWLQGFYYNASEVLEGIAVSERRGFGWLLWNANGNYDLAWLPTDDDIARWREEFEERDG